MARFSSAVSAHRGQNLKRSFSGSLRHSVGSSSSFDVFVFQKAKEILTESNIPHENCVICLYGFKVISLDPSQPSSGSFSCRPVLVCVYQEGEAFTKTSCYHYFHSHCLGRYVSHAERELHLREKELEEDKTRDRTLQQVRTRPACRQMLTVRVVFLHAASSDRT